uniref:Large ribosomal subunit protein bL32c n=1 Tax=Corydalis edulis TaxID=54428 RepID=A0A7S8HQ91_9MAGN|nr:ribosomal protein L32 [Corydalis edulis]QPC56938.1 ribosomal protein L32 [Corydalis edulis]
MAVPKKRTSLSKKRIRKNIWKRKGYWAARKAFSLAKSICTGNSKGFCGLQIQKNNQVLEESESI